MRNLEIGIALDCYDDLFSDFDIRDYDERAISRDFLDELRLRLRRFRPDATARILLLVPAVLRKADDENLIAARLRKFFLDRQEHYRLETLRTWRGLAIDTSIGIALFSAANIFVAKLDFFPLFRDFLLIPAWFFVWRGLESMIRNRSELHRKRQYYAVLAGSTIRFMDIEGFRDDPPE